MQNQQTLPGNGANIVCPDTEQYIRQLILDKAVLVGKSEIASNILHDIGNAVVGFGSYLNRMRRTLEQRKSGNLQNLANFFATQQTNLIPCLGEAKAEAVVNMLNSIADSYKTQQEELQKSLTEQQNLITHIQDILNIQRQYVNGNETYEKKPMHIGGVISDCLAMLFASIDKRGISITSDIPSVLPVIEGDRTRLMQVMLNLIKNSIEAIDVTAEQKYIRLILSHDPEWLTIEVRDNGAGFSEETSARLFTRGFTTKSSGSGLGLYNCRAIIESHEGSISIKSDGPGKGSVATVKFKI